VTWDFSGLTGTVVTKDDAAYQNARINYNTRISKYPAAIVFCFTVQDVQNAVNWVRTQTEKLPFRVRSGRHSYEEFSLVDKGLIIDVSQMKRFDIRQTSDGPVAVVGAGLTQGEIYGQVSQLGCAIAAGTAPDVGIAGVSLGGGIGMLTRQVGLALDNLLSIELVTPQGQLLIADNEQNQELFWALRGGGGGNFGVATAFTFKIHPIRDVTFYQLKWPYSQTVPVMHYWQQWAPDPDPRLTSQLTLHARLSGKGVTSEGLFLGPPGDLRIMLERWAEEVEPAYFRIEQTTFRQSTVYFAESDDLNCHPFKTTGAFIYDNLPADGLQTIKQYLDEAPTVDCALWMQSFGGAMAARRPDETAFFHRKARFIFEYVRAWHAKDHPVGGNRSAEWVESFRQALSPMTRGTYVNFVDSQLQDWLEMYYGENAAKLQAIKTKVDPENLFHFKQSIPLLEVKAPTASTPA